MNRRKNLGRARAPRAVLPHTLPAVETVAEVRSNTRLSPNGFLLSLKADIPSPLPGQFVMLGLPEGAAPFLRRPFSVLDFAPGRKRLEIFYSVEGQGTEILSRLDAGEKLGLRGPLGKPFPESKDKTHVLVAGGRGAAPLIFFSRKLRPSKRVIFLAGAKSEEELPLIDRARAGLVFLATDDGSAGREGTVMELLESLYEARSVRGKDAVLVGCGPTPMLSALHSFATSRRVPCLVSLEARMACGIGVCQGCAVRTRASRYAMVCKDGPVFYSRTIDWRKYGGA
jgi:dihydroorotate dehydrogenase electron transfer subunit